MSQEDSRNDLPRIKIGHWHYTISDPVISNGTCGVPRGVDGLIEAIDPMAELPITVRFAKRPELVRVKPEHLVNETEP